MINLVIDEGRNLKKFQGNKLFKTYINKVNLVVVTIVKFTWVNTWPTFIPEICKASKTDQSLCENNLNLLRILSEEIFDFSRNSMPSKEVRNLKKNMRKEFKMIFDLCLYVFKNQ